MQLLWPTEKQLIRLLPHSVEHGDVKVVAVNDPFIEPTYAVSPLKQP